jgi:hypothetical protein
MLVFFGGVLQLVVAVVVLIMLLQLQMLVLPRARLLLYVLWKTKL